jgi:glucose-6-phosphate isomerase/transaldolase/glucose-6-phosphate isomerase
LEHGFRRVFLNPPDIGGRYSVLSYFGLVPAALAGVDIATLLKRADGMRESCAACMPSHENPGAWLGAALGALAAQGRDKLTLVASPSIAGFSLWLEQLVAENLAKEGKGIVPVAGEPLAAPSFYGDDRLFVYLRLQGDDNTGADLALEQIEASGHPVMRLDLGDRYDLGAEFFRWEFGTVAAGALLGVHPFNQPNVQQAKELTRLALREYLEFGRLPRAEASRSPEELLRAAAPGAYLAVLAYLRQTPNVDQALAELRRTVLQRYRIATTLGYGPRYLHSTGQLHKGGPDTGLFLQITAPQGRDLPVPGEPYTFGVLADAQALADLRALREQGRPVARVHLRAGDESGIRELGARLAP